MRIIQKLVKWPPVENLPDLIDVRNHVPDFRGSRAMHIEARVHVLAMLFSILVLLWILVDYLTVGYQEFFDLFVARVGMAGLFIGLVCWRGRPNSLTQARIRLALLIIFPCLFYIFSRFILNGSTSEAAQMGYAFYPFVLVVQLAVFPLTLIEGIVLSIPVILSMIVVEVHFDQLFTLATLGDFWLLGLLISLAVWAEMSQLHMLLRLYRQATRDPLTGLFNRRLLMERLNAEITRAERYNHKLSVLLLDLDLFKRVNDTYGHLEGDKVLKMFSEMILGAIRESDLAGRYGGEEFLAILPETDAQAAMEVAERIREACKATPVNTNAGEKFHFTTSIGVAELQNTEDSDAIIGRADVSLYKAKDEGRDRVIVAS